LFKTMSIICGNYETSTIINENYEPCIKLTKMIAIGMNFPYHYNQ